MASAMNAGSAPPLRHGDCPRRGLRRAEAALYVGVSPSKFDELVKDGRMPKPKRLDSCVVWDVRQLDLAFDAIEGEDDGPNEWDT
jgi:predicted DNA-binding transcriptional regulator AlpA